MPTNNKYVKMLIDLVNKKLTADNTATLNYTGPKKLHDGNAFTFSKGSDGWTVYQGCELIVGDTSLEYCAQCVMDIIELSKE